MRSVLALVSLASIASFAAAQTGYGRFPCTLVNGDGTFSADQSQCANDALIAPGANDPESDAQGDGVNPVDAECVIESESGAYFCGIAGAACQTDDNCDNGVCGADGTCQGGFTQDCSGTDSNCLGYLYCLSGDYSTTPEDTCGAIGAFCQDYAAVSDPTDTTGNQPIFNQFCSSGYCNAGTASCDTYVPLGGDCTIDQLFGCGPLARCDTSGAIPTCVALPVASGGARARRNLHAKRNLCPASHEACSVPGAKGFECIDVTSNLEQCGACASAGGVDCTALPGVESVGCVAGTCEIWSCAEGFEWDAASSTCA
ncbi:hypothetical protein JCM6882_008698 [Rhodosporidiobolus microsporus]